MYQLIIADDEPLIRAGLYYRNNWKEMGFEVAAMLEDGSDVLQFLEENRADVLLTDICMFQVSGLEAAAKIRETYPWMRVVLLSGYREFEYAREALRCQVYDYLLKPIDYEKLREVFGKIREELDGQKREEQMLRSFGEHEYDQVLELTKAAAGAAAGESGESWIAYARLKPLITGAPPEVREILAKRLLEQLQDRLIQKDPELAKIFGEKLGQIHFSEGEQAHSQLIEVLSQLQDELISRGLAVPARVSADDSIARACQYISNHLGDDFTYRDAAEFVHLSPRHFIRRFRSEMNETFTDYVARCRMETAMKLLEEGTVDAADVAGAVGYHDEKYFQQLFKKHTGYTIREYQRSAEAGADNLWGGKDR